MSEHVLDASALLALLNGEAGAERVGAVIPNARISAVNLAEVVGKLAGHGLPADEASEAIASLGIQVEPFTAEVAYRAGELRVRTRDLGLSLGDRACLATGMTLGLPVMTADRSWTRAGLDVDVRLIRSDEVQDARSDEVQDADGGWTARARRRASWPGRKTRLVDQATEAPPGATTAEQRLAMMWPLALDAWALSGRPVPDYPRREAPGRVVRPAERARP